MLDTCFMNAELFRECSVCHGTRQALPRVGECGISGVVRARYERYIRETTSSVVFIATRYRT